MIITLSLFGAVVDKLCNLAKTVNFEQVVKTIIWLQDKAQADEKAERSLGREDLRGSGNLAILTHKQNDFRGLKFVKMLQMAK